MRVVDLFCGAGGMALGLVQAGLRIDASYDFEEKALAVHQANIKQGGLLRPHGIRRRRRHVQGDLGDLLTMAPDIAELAPDIIVGGPPCQPFSRAGKGLGDADPRAKLTEAFGVIVATARPKYFVMENVPDIQRFNVYRRTKKIVQRAGYGLTEIKLDASFYGTGQRRHRWLCIGCLGEADGFLLDYLEDARSDQPTTVADVLGPDIGMAFFRRGHDGGERRSFWPASEPSPTITSTQNRLRADSNDGDGYVLRESDIRALEEMGLEFDRLFWLTPGGSSTAGTRSVYEPAATFTHTSRHKQYSSYKPRKGDVMDVHSLPVLTFEQLSLLGGFPASWNWSPPLPPGEPKKPGGKPRARQITLGNKMQMLANSVPPPLARAIGECLLAHERGSVPTVKTELPPEYKLWLERSKGLTGANLSQALTDLRAAKSYVGSRVFRDGNHAVEILDQIKPFRALGSTRQSNLRRVLRTFYEYEAELAEKRRLREQRQRERTEAFDAGNWNPYTDEDVLP